MRITYYHFSSVDSTNSWPKRHKADFTKDELAIITADEQTQGRGRHLRHWHSPKGKNLYLSFAFFAAASSAPAPFFFSQLAALCLAAVLKNHSIDAQIKWPNDLLVAGKKIGGILTEAEKTEEDTFIILGIGLNVNMTKNDLATIPKAATSILIETDNEIPIKTIQDELVKEFLLLWEKTKKEGTQPLEKEWLKKVSWMLSKEITIVENEKELKGKVLAIEQDASLTLLLDDGTHYTVRSGDLFLR